MSSDAASSMANALTDVMLQSPSSAAAGSTTRSLTAVMGLLFLMTAAADASTHDASRGRPLPTEGASNETGHGYRDHRILSGASPTPAPLACGACPHDYLQTLLLGIPLCLLFKALLTMFIINPLMLKRFEEKGIRVDATVVATNHWVNTTHSKKKGPVDWHYYTMALTYPVEVPSRRVEADRSVVSKHLVAKPTDCPCSCGCICGCGGRGEKPPSEWSVSSDGVTIIYLGPPHDPREAMTSEQLKRRRRTCDCDGHKTCCGPLEKLICLAVRFVLCVLAVIETPFQVIIARVLLACPHPPPAL